MEVLTGHGVINFLDPESYELVLKGGLQMFNLSYDIPSLYSGVGLGINLVNDVISSSRETYIEANVPYTVRTYRVGNLCFGLKLGGRSFNIDWAKGIYKAKEDEQLEAYNRKRYS